MVIASHLVFPKKLALEKMKMKMKMNMLGRYFFALVLLGSSALQLLQVNAQDQAGFISLDCGLPADSKNYTESTTGINYMSDATFIETGIRKSILPEFQEGKEEQLWHVRSFPNVTRNCYRFNLTKGSKYLIRAYFMYANYDGLGSIPQFDLYIGPNKWATVSLENTSFVLIRELLHVLPLNYLHVCLVNTGSGTPFISALEIRSNFKSTVYKTETGSLNLFTRLDFASTTNRTIRYKDDIYDRIWKPYNSNGWAQLSTKLTIGTGNDYQPPSVVMQTAVTPENASVPLDFFLDIDDSTVQFYVYMHFAELRKLQANESRQFNITLRGQTWYGPLSPDHLSTITIYSKSALTGGNYTFSIRRTENSTLPPILNAIEVYSVRIFNQSETNQNDVDAITNIKSNYGLKNWQGDPCAPRAYMWDGLNCSINNNSSIPPRIISLNLSSSGLNGEIPRYLDELTSLQSLDLSHNNFAGSLPDFLSELPLTVLELSHNNFAGSVPDFLSQLPLIVLNLEGNNFSGSVPVGLLERSKNGTLKLSIDGNPNLCPSTSCKKKKNKNIVVPVVASVVGFVALVAAALAIFLFLRRRKEHGGMVATESSSKIAMEIESNNRQFSYSEVLKITNNFERILGKGGYGTVFYGRLDGNEVAVKMLSSESVHALKQFEAEVKLLMRVHHRNLTSLIGYCDDGDKMALIYEYMTNGNLLEHLSGSSKNALSWEVRLRIAVESAQGLEYLHNGCKPPIVHRDVKSNNILLNEKFQAKLGDFGMSKSFANEAHTHVTTVVAGTQGYVDPEYFRTNRLTEKSDVHSFGVVLLEIITSRPVIATNEHVKTHVRDWVNSLLTTGDIKSIADPRLQGDFDTNTVWKAVEVATACLSPTSNGRPTMSQIVMELSECLASEIARTNPGHGSYSKDSVDHMISMNLGSELNPSAR